MKIISAAQSIPHPEKKRGEDAYFFSGLLYEDIYYLLDFAFGVADGVGGWRQHGVDPGEFSRTVW